MTMNTEDKGDMNTHSTVADITYIRDISRCIRMLKQANKEQYPFPISWCALSLPIYHVLWIHTHTHPPRDNKTLRTTPPTFNISITGHLIPWCHYWTLNSMVPIWKNIAVATTFSPYQQKKVTCIISLLPSTYIPSSMMLPPVLI